MAERKSWVATAEADAVAERETSVLSIPYRRSVLCRKKPRKPLVLQAIMLLGSAGGGEPAMDYHPTLLCLLCLTSVCLVRLNITHRHTQIPLALFNRQPLRRCSECTSLNICFNDKLSSSNAQYLSRDFQHNWSNLQLLGGWVFVYTGSQKTETIKA